MPPAGPCGPGAHFWSRGAGVLRFLGRADKSFSRSERGVTAYLLHGDSNRHREGATHAVDPSQVTTERTPAPKPCASERPRDTADPATRHTGHSQHDTYHGVRTTGYDVARAHADVTAVSSYARENRMVWKESPERWRAMRKLRTAAGCDHRSSLLLSWHPACATSAGLGAEAGPANRPSLANSRLPMGFVSIALMTRLPSMSADLVPLTRRYSMPSSPWIWMSDGPTVRRR